MTRAANARVLAAAMDENALLACVIDLARALSVRTAHFRPCLTAKGHRTAVSGDGKGFPDLVLAGRSGLLFRELKSVRGRESAEQRDWLWVLGEAGADAGIWRPADWLDGTIARELRGIT